MATQVRALDLIDGIGIRCSLAERVPHLRLISALFVARVFRGGKCFPISSEEIGGQGSCSA